MQKCKLNDKELVTMFKRSSGMVLHISSLPSPYGIGSMGKAAYQFVDFLAKGGQT